MPATDLTCRELVEALTDYLERGLPARQRIRVEQHLVVCSDCARYVDHMHATILLTERLERDELGPETQRELLTALEGWMSKRG